MWISKILIFALAWVCGSVSCHAADTARLFIAQKGNHIAFFLPLVHTPTVIEKDEYLHAVIEPAFRRSTTLYDESVQNAHIYPTAIHPCRRHLPLSPVSQQKLDAISAPIAQLDIFSFPAPWILRESDFIKMMLVVLGPVVPDLAKLPPNFAAAEFQISAALARKFAIEHQSIESMDDWKSVYCSLSLQEKTNTVNAMFTDAKANVDASEFQRSQAYLRALACITAALVHDDACYDSTSGQIRWGTPAWRMSIGKTKLLLSGRNQIWVEKIKANSKLDGVPFYAFGVAHFLRNSKGPGIFAQLQRAGFRLQRIRNLGEIPDVIMARAALPRSAEEPLSALSENP